MKGSDQISKLPESILEHILSFLVVKESAKTSILSKAWNSAWTSLSCLDFGDKFFVKSKNIVVDQILATGLKQKILIRRFMLLPDYWSKTLDTLWYSKLTKSLGNFSHSKAIELCCNSDTVLVIPIDMRENLLPPLYGAKHLHIICKYPSYSVVDFVDSLLWISPQLDTLSFKKPRSSNNLKFIYRDTADEDEKPCCPSLHLKCWRHNLKEVELQKFTFAELEELRNYFLTNADILQIVEVPLECSL
ncbi:hypothetical protein K7X08_004157 [Anisodus acutangulus]|uniref:F-box domain-containing protein n=1 Tax=Anisodus acutangulus TaxID=402998 RepID=A0A9Q1RJV0_9SOLA|nr:hypothetical protein K7X08_004157 [Anisodus acutangulus]